MARKDIVLSIDEALLRRAAGAGLDLTLILEGALADLPDSTGVAERDAAFDDREAAAEARAARWAADNAEAISDYNRRIAERGVIGKEWRRW
ncbi:MAG: type II toxin-antitoxin system CcdA family antitoxin [Caulobacter sp.]|nr:type II toxin-antitoxin system CcdA family antitoxin [Caulobacter sp.]